MIPNFVMHEKFCIFSIATTGNNNLHLGGTEGPQLHQHQNSLNRMVAVKLVGCCQVILVMAQ